MEHLRWIGEVCLAGVNGTPIRPGRADLDFEMNVYVRRRRIKIIRPVGGSGGNTGER
jgi:hypothetical protein